MILLNGHSLEPARRVPVEAMSLTLKERESTASLTPADMTGIGTESWLLDDKEPGAGIVWRVRSIGTAYATQTPTVQLEHVISTLKDRILFGETTPSVIAGGNVETCTARQAVEYILRQQSDWVLGQFDFSVTNAYKFDGDSLFDCLETVTETLDDAWWSYDLTRYPFRLNITRKNSTVGSELRCGRNLRTITRTIDRSGMYTRFYPIGKDDLHLSTLYAEKNTALYGVIEHTETDTSRETEAELRSWANEKLSRHAEPVVNIDVEGFELVQSTGEALDRLTLGRMCRVPMPEFSTTITERIVSLTYQDKVHQPEVVRITLANNRDDITRIIADNMKAGGRGGRGAARQAKEDHAWFEDTNDHVAMVAEGIVGTDAQGNPNWTLLSQIIVDGTGIHQDVTETQNGLAIANTHIEQNSRAITLEAQRASTAEGQLSGRITVAADAINAEVTRAQGAENALSGRITVEAGKITQIVSAVGQNGQVTAASIVLAVNNSGSSVRLDADKVYIGNQKSTTVINGKLDASAVTADYINGFLANISLMNCQSIATNSASGTATFSSFYGNHFYVGRGGGGGGVSYSDVANGIADVQIDGPTNNEYKLQYKRFGDVAWTDGGTFSRATSLSGEWSGTVAAGKSYKVTASPQGTTHYSPSLDGMSTRAGSKSWASDYKSFTQKLYVYDSNGTDLYEETMTFLTSDSYNKGKEAGEATQPGSVTVSSTSSGTQIANLSASGISAGKFINLKVADHNYNIKIS